MEIVKFKTLWYTDEEGGCIEHPKDGFLESLPEEFVYQHSRFPNQLREDVYKLITRKEVDQCTHPVEHVVPTYGWKDGITGRRCNKCGGSQITPVTHPWPKEWDASGSRLVFTGTSAWPPDLVEAMVRDHGWDITEAIQTVAMSCERCLNVLYSEYAPYLDKGYYEFSAEWQRCPTSCVMCEDYNKKGSVFIHIYKELYVLVSDVHMSEEAAFENGDGLMTFNMLFDQRYLSKYLMSKEQVEQRTGDKILQSLMKWINSQITEENVKIMDNIDIKEKEYDLSEIVDEFTDIDEIPDMSL